MSIWKGRKRAGKPFRQVYKELTEALGFNLSAEEVYALQREWHSRLVRQGLTHARERGKTLGRPFAVVPLSTLEIVCTLPLSTAMQRFGVSRSTVKRWRRRAMDSCAPTS